MNVISWRSALYNPYVICLCEQFFFNFFYVFYYLFYFKQARHISFVHKLIVKIIRAQWNLVSHSILCSFRETAKSFWLSKLNYRLKIHYCFTSVVILSYVYSLILYHGHLKKNKIRTHTKYTHNRKWYFVCINADISQRQSQMFSLCILPALIMNLLSP